VEEMETCGINGNLWKKWKLVKYMKACGRGGSLWNKCKHVKYLEFWKR
jgi:hypothetical protein